MRVYEDLQCFPGFRADFIMIQLQFGDKSIVSAKCTYYVYFNIFFPFLLYKMQCFVCFPLWLPQISQSSWLDFILHIFLRVASKHDTVLSLSWVENNVLSSPCTCGGLPPSGCPTLAAAHTPCHGWFCRRHIQAAALLPLLSSVLT